MLRLTPGPLSHRQEWLVFRQLLRDSEIGAVSFAAIDAVSEMKSGRAISLDLGLLRLLETRLLLVSRRLGSG